MGKFRDLVMRCTARQRVRQYGALPYRMDETGEPVVLLVTSRGGQHWIVPKGWPSVRLKPHEAAAREAFEEGGVRGRIDRTSFGMFRHEKRLRSGRVVRCDVTLFALEVVDVLEDWPEARQRRRRWVAVEEAARLVGNADLARAIGRFRALICAGSAGSHPGVLAM